MLKGGLGNAWKMIILEKVNKLKESPSFIYFVLCFAAKSAHQRMSSLLTSSLEKGAKSCDDVGSIISFGDGGVSLERNEWRSRSLGRTQYGGRTKREYKDERLWWNLKCRSHLSIHLGSENPCHFIRKILEMRTVLAMPCKDLLCAHISWTPKISIPRHPII